MDTLGTFRPLLAVLICIVAAVVVLLLRKRANLRDASSLVAATLNFLVVASMAPTILAGGTIECNLFRVLPGIDFSFRVDPLGMIFATISSLLWIVAAL